MLFRCIFPRLSTAGVARFVLACAVCVCVLSLAVTTVSAESVRARPRSESTAPARVTVAGVSYTEVRAVFSRIGYKSNWNAKSREITLTKGGNALVFTADSREATVLGLRTFLGEAVVLRKGVLYVATIDLERFILPIVRPERSGSKPLRVIVIDAGHGGNDSGTQSASGKLQEKTFTLDVAKRLQRLLAGGDWRVVMTRTDDRYISLADRAASANAVKADLFISIHFNAVSNNSSVRGTETYVLTPRFQRSTSSASSGSEDKVEHPGNSYDAWSSILGYQMHRQLLAKLKTEDRGFKHARFAVLRLVNCPGVLVEAGYLSNDGEARKIADPAYRGDIAEALASAVNAYANSLSSVTRSSAK